MVQGRVQRDGWEGREFERGKGRRVGERIGGLRIWLWATIDLKTAMCYHLLH